MHKDQGENLSVKRDQGIKTMKKCLMNLSLIVNIQAYLERGDLESKRWMTSSLDRLKKNDQLEVYHRVANLAVVDLE